jgi:hypothetical protein
MKIFLLISALIAFMMSSAQAVESQWKYIGTLTTKYGKYKYYLAPLLGRKGYYYTYSSAGIREILVVNKGGSMDLAVPERFEINCHKNLIKEKVESDWISPKSGSMLEMIMEDGCELP